MEDKNFTYYEEHAEEYCRSTFSDGNFNTLLYFLNMLKLGSNILDLGCGSGRDTVFMKRLNFNVTAVDYSPKICHITAGKIGQQVLRKDILKDSFSSKYDAVWANASLVHLSKEELNEALKNIFNLLENNGLLYISLKESAMKEKERSFLEIKTEEVLKILENTNFKCIKTFKTKDVLVRSNMWLNFICQKKIIKGEN